MSFTVEMLLEQGPDSGQLHTECVHLVGGLCQALQPCALTVAHCVAPSSLFGGTVLST